MVMHETKLYYLYMYAFQTLRLLESKEHHVNMIGIKQPLHFHFDNKNATVYY